MRIPGRVAEDLSLKDGSDVDLLVVDGLIVLTPIRANQGKVDLDELVSGISSANRHGAEDWGQ